MTEPTGAGPSPSQIAAGPLCPKPESSRVWLEGEAWNAVSDKPVRKDQFVVVRRLDGLTLSVEPIAATPETNPELQT
jgi:membrane-bound ClpP family serine protease